MNSHSRPRGTVAILLMLIASLYAGSAWADAINGAIYTSLAGGETVNANNYDLKSDVYLNGGPNNSQCSSGALDPGDYYFQVTDPSGATLLSSDAIGERAIRVAGGVISQYLGATHATAANTGPCGGISVQLIPYDDTPNSGGVYKVWVTRISDYNAQGGFVGGHIKTDNFRVKEDGDDEIDFFGALEAYKFYDANANGVFDVGTDLDLEGWPMTLQSVNQTVDSTQSTGADGTTLWDPLLPDSDYYVTEGTPIEGNWVHSATIYLGHDGTPQNPAGPLTVAVGETTTVAFGNYCTVPSNGRTLGFWSNKNGQALIGAGDLALLVALNLRNADGSDFDPNTKAALKSWLLNGTAVNMAYMLSVQLAAMELNVYNGFVNGGGYYVPASMTINQLMAAANTSLGLYPMTKADNDPFGQRSNQEQLKNWLDQLNNGAGVLSPTPCAYTFD